MQQSMYGAGDVKGLIMQRVKFIFFVRKVGKPVIIETAVLGAATLALTPFVSISDIILNSENTMAGGSLVSYLTSAVMNTEVFVQAILAAVALCSIYLLYRGFGEVFLWFRPAKSSGLLVA